MGKTLVTGATGFLGSHVAHALAERGDDLRLCVREDSRLENLEDLDCERVTCDILDRRALGRALRGVERVFHVAGLTSMRASAEELFRVNVEGTRAVLEACLRAGVERVVYTSSIAAIGPASPGEAVDERSTFDAARLGIPYVNAKREAEVEALRIAAHGLPVVIVNPGTCWGRGPQPLLHRDRAALPAAADPRLRRRRAEHRWGWRTSPAATCWRTSAASPGERYILGNRNYTLDRLFADLGRLSGVEPPALKLPGGRRAGPRLRRRAPAGQPGDHRHRGPRGRAVVDLSQHEGQARAGLEAVAPRGDDRDHGRLVPGPRGRPSHPRRVAPAREPADGGDRGAGRRAAMRRACASTLPDPSTAMATLYRCITPTNVLCPCGRIARELAGRLIPFDEVRVPMRKVRRGEVLELTGQSTVPVLVHEGEVVHDSRRIVTGPRSTSDGLGHATKTPAGSRRECS